MELSRCVWCGPMTPLLRLVWSASASTGQTALTSLIQTAEHSLEVFIMTCQHLWNYLSRKIHIILTPWPFFLQHVIVSTVIICPMVNPLPSQD